MMNAGITMLTDNAPCIVYDERLPHPIKHVEFNWADYRVTLVYDTPAYSRFSHEGHRFDFPLDSAFIPLLKQLNKVAVGRVDNDKLVEIAVFPLVFVNVNEN